MRVIMIDSAGLSTAWIAIHLIGLIVSVMVRTQVGGRFEGLVQAGFLACLSTIGLATTVGYYGCMQMWPVSAVTLALMIVIAVVDFSSTRSLPAGS